MRRSVVRLARRGIALLLVLVMAIAVPRVPVRGEEAAANGSLALIRAGRISETAADPGLRPGPLPLFYEPSTRFHRKLVGLPNGDLDLRFVDVLVPAEPEPLMVQRRYRSGRHRGGVFGLGWTSNLDVKLRRVPGTNDREIVETDGSLDEYRSLGNGRYATVLAGMMAHTLQREADGSFVRRWQDGTVELFDENGRFVKRSNGPASIALSYPSKSATLPAAMTLSSGRGLRFTYDRTHLTGVVDELGRTTKYAYQDGRLTQVNDALGRQATFVYAGGRLAQMVLPGGGTLDFAYDGSGVLQRIAGPGSVRTTLAWERDPAAAGLRLRAVDAAGRAATLEIAPTLLDGKSAGMSFKERRGDRAGFAATFAGNRVIFTSPSVPGTLELKDGRLSNLDDTGMVAAFAALGEHWRAVMVPGMIPADRDDVRYDAAGRPVELKIDAKRSERWKWDDGDRLVEWTDFTGNATMYGYDPHDHLVAVKSGRYGESTFAYGPADELTSVRTASGAETHLAYDAAGVLTSLSEPGGTSTLAYDADGRLSEVRSPGRRTAFRYDPEGRTTRVVTNGRITADFAYDARGNLMTATDAIGAQTRFVSAGEEKIAEARFPDGHTVKLRYDGGAVAMQTLLGEGKSAEQRYDANGRLVAVQSNGREITATYDSDGKLTEIVDPSAGKTTYSYDDGGLLTAVADPAEGAASYRYDGTGRVIHVDRGSVKIDIAYAADGTETDTIEENGIRSQLTHDVQGRLTSETDADGNATTYEYTPGGALSNVNAPGARLHSDYDAQGRLSRVTRSWDGGSAAIGYGYDGAGRLVSVTNEDGTVERTEYDLAGRRIATVGVDRRAVRFGYDAAGLLALVDGPDGARRFRYDARGRMTRREDPATGPFRYEYDDPSHDVAIVDALGRRTLLRFDGNERPTEARDAAGGVRKYAYDALGNVESFTDPLGKTWRQSYDGAGHLLERVLPSGKRFAFRYDAGGRLTETASPDGRPARRVYDGSGRLLSTDDGVSTVTLRYDKLGRVETVAQTAVNASTASPAAADTTAATYSYDALNRVTNYKDRFGKEVAIKYDPAGRAVGFSNADAGDVAYRYDDRGLVDAIESRAGTIRFAYDDAARLASTLYPNGMRAEYAYEGGSRLRSLQYKLRDAILYVESYRYDALGNVVAVDGSGGRRTYAYDALNRLIASTGPGGKRERYAYDAAGNITSTSESSGWAYDDDQELTRAGDRGLTYDAAGNVTSIDRLGTFRFDADGRLLEAATPDHGTFSYAYDANGKRIEKRSGPDDGVRYLYAGDELLAEYDVKGSPRATYVPGTQGQWIAVRKDGKEYFPLRARLGTLVAVVDDRGTVVQRFAYDSFGRVSGSSGRTIVPAEFAGQPRDEESGLVPMGARYYAPKLRRFMSPDPAGFDRDGNRYAYALDNPLRFVDSSGATTSAWMPRSLNAGPNVAAMTPAQRVAYANTLARYAEAAKWGPRDPAAERAIIQELVRIGKVDDPSVDRVVRQTLDALANGKQIDVRSIAIDNGIANYGTRGRAAIGGPSAYVFKDAIKAQLPGEASATVRRVATGTAAHEITHTLQSGQYNLLHEWEARYNQWLIDRTVGTGRPLTIDELRDLTLRDYTKKFPGQNITADDMWRSVTKDFFKAGAPVENVSRVENAVDKLRAMRVQGALEAASRDVVPAAAKSTLRGTVREAASSIAAKSRVALFEAEMRATRLLSKGATAAKVLGFIAKRALPFVPALVAAAVGIYHGDIAEIAKGLGELRYGIPILGEAFMAIDGGVFLGEKAAAIYIAAKKKIDDFFKAFEDIANQIAAEDDQTKGLRRRAARANGGGTGGFGDGCCSEPLIVSYFEPPTYPDGTLAGTSGAPDIANQPLGGPEPDANANPAGGENKAGGHDDADKTRAGENPHGGSNPNEGKTSAGGTNGDRGGTAGGTNPDRSHPASGSTPTTGGNPGRGGNANDAGNRNGGKTSAGGTDAGHGDVAGSSNSGRNHVPSASNDLRRAGTTGGVNGADATRTGGNPPNAIGGPRAAAPPASDRGRASDRGKSAPSGRVSDARTGDGRSRGASAHSASTAPHGPGGVVVGGGTRAGRGVDDAVDDALGGDADEKPRAAPPGSSSGDGSKKPSGAAPGGGGTGGIIGALKRNVTDKIVGTGTDKPPPGGDIGTTPSDGKGNGGNDGTSTGTPTGGLSGPDPGDGLPPPDLPKPPPPTTPPNQPPSNAPATASPAASSDTPTPIPAPPASAPIPVTAPPAPAPHPPPRDKPTALPTITPANPPRPPAVGGSGDDTPKGGALDRINRVLDWLSKLIGGGK